MVFSHISDAEFCPHFLSMGVIVIANIAHVKFAIERFLGREPCLIKPTPRVHILIRINSLAD